jgi:hypothetical protein
VLRAEQGAGHDVALAPGVQDRAPRSTPARHIDPAARILRVERAAGGAGLRRVPTGLTTRRRRDRAPRPVSRGAGRICGAVDGEPVACGHLARSSLWGHIAHHRREAREDAMAEEVCCGQSAPGSRARSSVVTLSIIRAGRGSAHGRPSTGRLLRIGARRERRGPRQARADPGTGPWFARRRACRPWSACAAPWSLRAGLQRRWLLGAWFHCVCGRAGVVDRSTRRSLNSPTLVHTRRPFISSPSTVASPLIGEFRLEN